MEASTGWKEFFRNWPDEMPRSGVLVTSFGEQIPFDGFMLTDTLLLIQRKTPDTVGTRQLVLSYQNILALKITDVVKPKVFTAQGFEGRPSKKSARQSRPS